jgi:hypothetical protein
LLAATSVFLVAKILFKISDMVFSIYELMGLAYSIVLQCV